MSTDQPPNGMPSDGTRKPGGEPAEPDPPAGEQPAPGGAGTTRPVSGPEPVPPADTPPPPPSSSAAPSRPQSGQGPGTEPRPDASPDSGPGAGPDPGQGASPDSGLGASPQSGPGAGQSTNTPSTGGQSRSPYDKPAPSSGSAPPPGGSPYDTPPGGPAGPPYDSAQAGSTGSPYDSPPGGSGGPPHGTPPAGSGGSPYDNPPGGSGGSPYDNPPGGTGGPYNTPPGGTGGPYNTPPGGTGSPYDTPPGGTPPYPGAGGAPHGETDPRLAGMPPLGSLGKRLLARIIDGLLIGVPMAIILAAAGVGYDFSGNQVSGGWTSSLLTMAAYFVYEGLMLTRDGQTVGKKLMKIRVAMLENGAIPAGNAGWIRAAVYSLPEIIPCIGFLFWLYNVLSCTWDKPYHQAVHDKVAKTVVVQAVPQHAPQQPAQHAPSQGPPPAA